MRSFWWWLCHPFYWRLWSQRNRRREQLGLQLMAFLSVAEQSVDDIAPTQKIVTIVNAIEAGLEVADEDAARLWQRALQHPEVAATAQQLQQLTQALRPHNYQPISIKQLRRQRRESTRAIEFESLAMTIQLPLFIPLASAFFLFSGYVYTNIFFASFPLNVSRYFGLTDYISASMDGLMPTLIAVAVSLLSLVLLRRSLRLNSLQRQLRVQNGVTLLTLIGLGVMLYFFKRVMSPDEFRLLAIYGAMVGFGASVVPYFSAYAKRPNLTLLVSNFVVLYVAVIWFTAAQAAQKIKRPSTQSSVVVLSDEQNTVLEHRLIAGNSLYLFLLDDSGAVIVVPVNSVKHITHDKKNPKR